MMAIRARICKPFKEPRNRFPWIRFLGIDSVAPETFTNTGSVYIFRTSIFCLAMHREPSNMYFAQ